MVTKKSYQQTTIHKKDPKKIAKEAPKGKAGGSLKKAGVKTETFFEKAETYLSPRLNKVLLTSLCLTLLFSLLLFDIRFSIAGDDSSYVERAYDFIKHFTYPGFSGPLYPIVLSPLVGLFGIHAIPLKSLSLLFILGCIYFLFRAYRNRIPALLLTSVLALLSVNSFMLYFASQTYSEGFFLFLQALVALVFFTFFVDREESSSFKPLLQRNLLLAVCVLVLGLSRTIGFTAALAFIVYFALKGQWKNILFLTGSFIVVFMAFQGVKMMLWGSGEVHFTGQFENMVAKNYYNLAGGREDFAGFVNRLIENSNYYFSDCLYTIFGLRAVGEYNTLYPLLAVIIWLMLIAATVFSFRKNKYLLFTGIYLLILVFATFLLTQTVWRQSRLIVAIYPMIVLMIFSLVYYILSLRQLKGFQFVFPLLVIILLGFTLKVSFVNIQEARKISSKYYGLTPDWENYCRASEWTAVNLPAGSCVACRKPSISFIYGDGKRYFGITRIPVSPGNEMLTIEMQQKNRYLFINPASIENKTLPDYLFNTFKSGLAGYGMINENNYLTIPFYMIKIPDTAKARVFAEMRRLGIPGTEHPDTVKTWIKNPVSVISIIYPDSLVGFLRKAGVTHVIRASLRADAKEKNGYTNNTVERFFDYIQFKYPGFATKVVQIGSDDNEPAAVYELKYP